jgi:hypothetical protein
MSARMANRLETRCQANVDRLIGERDFGLLDEDVVL